jgi:glycosyltransferase involved in cell wall biosynthesis|tara:strand:- start:3680 stop:4759 length:1080 start_codon:yes stop_codon:yes gene_type:complete
MGKRWLLPYISRSGHNIHSKIVGGGIEKGVKNLYELFPDNIIPVEITKEDRKRRLTKKVFLDSVQKFQPDIIIINDLDACFVIPQIKNNIPTIMVMHEPLSGDIRYVAWYKNIQKFIDAGGHLYFMSEHQMNFHNKNAKRISGETIIGIKGIIDATFANGNETVSNNIKYDAVTVGRTDLTKNPFLLHKKLASTNLTSCVITNKENFQESVNQQRYFNENLHWKEPQYTFRGLNHDDTMKTMSEGACYISTCAIESWGQTCLEALVHGLPVILLSDKSGKHASEIIPADNNHIKILNKNAKPDELAKCIDEFKNLSYEERLAISEATKKKHSKKLYKEKWEQMIYNASFSKTKWFRMVR